MTYQELEEILKSNHLSPSREVTVGKKGEKITGLHIETPPILMYDRKKRLEEILEGTGAVVQKLSNKDYLLITLK